MEDEVQELEKLSLECQNNEKNISWKQEWQQHQSQVDRLEEKLTEVTANIQCSEGSLMRELELLWDRVKTTATLLTYLKSKARIMAVPHLAHTSCGIKYQEGVGFIDRHGSPVAEWSKEVDLSSFRSSDVESLSGRSLRPGKLNANENICVIEELNSVRMITDVMESLVKRIIIAETEVAAEKDKVDLSLEEIRLKTLQIERMSVKIEEMEKFALSANNILNEMRQKVDDMVQETSRQRQRATENEQELSRVKQEFEALTSYVSSLISVRETLLSSEKQFQTMEKLFDRLIVKTTQLESEKLQKEAEVQKLLAENVRLSAVLDQKEAQLLAMKEQCKLMALNNL